MIVHLTERMCDILHFAYIVNSYIRENRCLNRPAACHIRIMFELQLSHLTIEIVSIVMLRFCFYFLLYAYRLYIYLVPCVLCLCSMFNVQFIRLLDNVFNRVNERGIYVFIEKPVLHCQSALSSIEPIYNESSSENVRKKTNKKFRTTKIEKKTIQSWANGYFLASHVNCSNQTFLIRKSTGYNAENPEKKIWFTGDYSIDIEVQWTPFHFLAFWRFDVLMHLRFSFRRAHNAKCTVHNHS